MSTTKQFYEKNIAKSGARDRTGQPVVLPQRGDRYYAVLAHVDAPATARPTRAIELGFGGMANVEWISAQVDMLDIADLVDRTLGATPPANVRFTECDLNSDFPFADTTYELVVALMVVEHLFDPFHSFREISRILQPGGYAIVNLPLVTGIRNRWRLLTGHLPVTSRPDWFEIEEWDGGHLHYFSMASIERLAKKFNLKPLSWYPVGNLLGLKAIAPSLLCSEISVILKKL